MDTIPIGKLNLGKVDGKHEYLSPRSSTDERVFDAFLVPENVDLGRLHNGDYFFIEGFRGTGKTSLLRWHAQDRRRSGSSTRFILFKSDLTESQRLSISKEVGIDWSDIDSGSMEISQDFKAAWKWFILHKIGEVIQAEPGIIKNDGDKFLRLLGLVHEGVFTKSVGFMPKLEGANVRIKSDLGLFQVELGGDFKTDGNHGKATLDALGQAALRQALTIRLARQLYVYFDELEVFYSLPEQFKRDQRMVRDLIFAIAELNDRFRDAGVDVHLIGAVRSEVVDQMGSLGQEVDRLVHDRGFSIAWHHANRSMNHPLLRIVARKISASEGKPGQLDQDVLKRYFPDHIDGQPIDAILLDRSFYKPRDLVWRLTLAQKIFPTKEMFDREVLFESESDYSAKLWDEIRYELSAGYSDNEVDIIEGVLSGGARYFGLDDVNRRFGVAADRSPAVSQLLNRRPVVNILSDLYRLGAIGNAFRAGPSAGDIRNRWAFRGDTSLLVDKRMELHAAITKRLAAVAKRRRGSQGGRGRKN